jgi:hypothetical protein
MSVLTDDAFAAYGCSAAPAGPKRRACEQGAGEIDEPLVTFS